MMLGVPACQPPASLDLYQLAVLAGGARRACETAATVLVERGLARAVPRTGQDGRLYAHGDLPPTASPVELAVHAAAAQSNTPALFGALHEFHLRVARDRERAGKLNERQRDLRVPGGAVAQPALAVAFWGVSILAWTRFQEVADTFRPEIPVGDS